MVKLSDAAAKKAAILYDVGGPFIENCIVRIARKAHRCRSCKRPITSGDSYVEYVGETPAFSSGESYCLECANKELKDDEPTTRVL